NQERRESVDRYPYSSSGIFFQNFEDVGSYACKIIGIVSGLTTVACEPYGSHLTRVNAKAPDILKHFVNSKSSHIEADVPLNESRMSEPVTESLLADARRPDDKNGRSVRVYVTQ